MTEAEIIKWLSPKAHAWGLSSLSKTKQKKLGLIPDPWAKVKPPEKSKT
jgi:hypothetical protein